MNKRKSLSKFILLILEKAVDGYVRYDDLIHHSSRYAYGDGWDKPLNKSALATALKRLRENGLVDFIDDETLILRLTDKGKSKALWVKMRLEDEKWDGKWRLVIWDIPEKRKRVRDLLRHQLKQLGFEKLQNSVWTSKKNCAKLLEEYIERVGIGDWVKVLETKDLNF